jgi:hypothetical protein
LDVAVLGYLTLLHFALGVAGGGAWRFRHDGLGDADRLQADFYFGVLLVTGVDHVFTNVLLLLCHDKANIYK